jgi:hypothetical protein
MPTYQTINYQPAKDGFIKMVEQALSIAKANGKNLCCAVRN